MADKPNCIVSADRKYRVEMEFNNQAFLNAIAASYPAVARRLADQQEAVRRSSYAS